MRVPFYSTLVVLGIAAVLISGCESARYVSPGGQSTMIPSVDLNKPAGTEQAAFALG